MCLFSEKRTPVANLRTVLYFIFFQQNLNATYRQMNRKLNTKLLPIRVKTKFDFSIHFGRCLELASANIKYKSNQEMLLDVVNLNLQGRREVTIMASRACAWYNGFLANQNYGITFTSDPVFSKYLYFPTGRSKDDIHHNFATSSYTRKTSTFLPKYGQIIT